MDQRADVFAIGAMLWELCSLQKVPPIDRRLRHQMLRRAGIDSDLITIIDKALASNPEGRYPDAGQLADDLRAFKAGARIAARSYSLLDMLAHWTRRHRVLAWSEGCALIVAIAVGVLYARSITAERDRTTGALERVEVARNDLVLEHAELLLHSDPTAALAALGGYNGTEPFRHTENFPRTTSQQQRAAQVAADALGRGTAAYTFHPTLAASYSWNGLRLESY